MSGQNGKIDKMDGFLTSFLTHALWIFAATNLASSRVPLACIPLKEMDRQTDQHVPCTSRSCHVLIVIGPNKLVPVARIVGRPVDRTTTLAFNDE